MKRALLFAVVLMLAANLPANLSAGAADDSPLHLLPLSSGTVDPANAWEAADPASHDLVLVQFDRFGAPGMVDGLAGTGAVLVQPLAPVSYLVWADAAQVLAIRAMNGVRWAGVMPAAARISGGITAATTRLRVTLVGTWGLSGLPAASVRPRAFTGASGAVVTLPGGSSLAGALAALPRVYSVADAGGRPMLRDEKANAVITQGTKSGALRPEYRAFLQRIGADGTGVVVSHVDGGVDQNHPELLDRIQACIDYSRAGQLCAARNTDDAIGHGTHTLGIVLGTGLTTLGDVESFDYGLGVAPGAKAVVQNAISLNTLGAPDPFANGYRPVYRQASDLGAIVSQNSWGPSGTPKGYDADTREFDSIVRDADETEQGDQAMGLVFSIMNGSGGTSTQGTPDEGKNIIGVGGTGIRGTSPGPDDLCTCSAHGPALDGRLLPTLVAPGQNVMSTRAAQGTLCGLSGSAAEVPPSPLHAPCTGTSMASPHVSGAYAVFVDWYRDHFGGKTPSPALVKAALVNGAVDIAGGKDADGGTMGPIPNNKQGWGRLNIANSVDRWAAGQVHVDQSVVFTDPGQSYTTSVVPVDPAKPMKASLVWTDALGPGLGGNVPAWINDLDLTVTAAGGAQWFGNVFSGGLSTTGGAYDRMNNIENVYLAQPGAQSYTVSVTAANIIGDGLPNVGGPTDQDFALVITNAQHAP